MILFLKICFRGTNLWVCLWKPDKLAGCFAPRALIPHSAELVYSQALFWSKLVPLEAKCGKLGFRTVHSGDSSGQHGYDISSLDPFVHSLSDFALGDVSTPSSHLFRTCNTILLSCCKTFCEATMLCIHYFSHFSEEEHPSYQWIIPQGQRLWHGLKAALSPVLSCVDGVCRRALTLDTEIANGLAILSPLWCRYV